MTTDMVVNALAKTMNGSYKIAMIKYFKSRLARFSRCTNATLNYIYWFNKKRVHSALGYVSPFEFEAMYYDKINPLGQVVQLK